MTSSSLVICPVAVDSSGVSHLGFGDYPEFKNYIESVFPQESICSYNKWNNFVITTKFSGLIEAVPEVTLPSGEKRGFSYWLLEPEHAMVAIHCKEKMFFKGQHGIVGMYFGVKDKLEPKFWPKSRMNEIKAWVRSINDYHHHLLLSEESLATV